VSVAGFDLGLAGYAQTDGEAFQRRALDAVLRLPGVSAAAFSDSFPLGVDQSNSGVYRFAETNFRASTAIRVSHYEVSPAISAPSARTCWLGATSPGMTTPKRRSPPL
jgi:hypothetical protein